MKIFANKILVLISLIVFAFTFAASYESDKISQSVKSVVKERVDSGTNAGIIVGVIDEQGEEYFSYGKKSDKNRSKPDKNTFFEIGSITKVFTAIVLADMELKGEISGEDEIGKYLPAEISTPERNGKFITLNHLVSHTSGLPRMPSNFRPADRLNPFKDYRKAQLYEFLSSHSLSRDIGEKSEYSNVGMGLLGHILSLREGKSYEDMVIGRICAKLGLKDTRVTMDSKMKKKLAVGYNWGKEVPNWDMDVLAGAGALRSTAKDMLTFLSANFGLIETPLFDALQKTHIIKTDTDNPNMKVGMAWHIIINESSEIIWHNGGTGGYRTFIGFDKKRRIGVTVLSNSNVSADDIGFHILDNSYKLR